MSMKPPHDSDVHNRQVQSSTQQPHLINQEILKEIVPRELNRGSRKRGISSRLYPPKHIRAIHFFRAGSIKVPKPQVAMPNYI